MTFLFKSTFCRKNTKGQPATLDKLVNTSQAHRPDHKFFCIPLVYPEQANRKYAYSDRYNTPNKIKTQVKTNKNLHL